MKNVKNMIAEANKAVDCLTAQEVIALHGDYSVQFVDLRDIGELQREGAVPGAVHCPRGMLEFRIDKESPYAKPEFQEDNRFVFFCASGGRSALSALTAQNMGLKDVSHILTGFGGWKQEGGPVEELPK